MPWRKTYKTSIFNHRVGRTGGKARAKIKRKLYRKKGKARPIRALSVGYKGMPNQYRFVRETVPVTIDIGDPTSPGVTHLPALTPGQPNQAYFKMPPFSVNDLAGNFLDFNGIFANYRVDKITVSMIPQWSNQTQPYLSTINPAASVPNLVVTRLNTKYLIDGYTPITNAEGNRDKLAQIQKKSRSFYGTKKWLKLVTNKPEVGMNIQDGAGGTNLGMIKAPWLPILTAADQEYAINDMIFCDRLDGTSFVVGQHKYRLVVRVHFRCAFVG